MEEQKPHKRRVRYSGTHPTKFTEKYKELDPEKYKDTIEHIIQKGNTPAGMHLSIMVDEILDHLQIQEGEIGLDATLGYGGHTTKMLEQLHHTGHLYALDIDPIEIVKTEKRLRDKGYSENELTIKRTNFRNLKAVAQEVGGFDFILADLGVSSMQIDNPERGFTFKKDGPLDLRLDPSKGIPARDRLNELSLPEIEGMLVENSDEPYAHQIAIEIVKNTSKGNTISTTKKLYSVVESACKSINKKMDQETIKKTCQRVFQAIRIDVNSEFEVLYEFLDALGDALKPNGRVCILTFHSGEDRLVKKAFKAYYKEGVFKEIAGDVIRPSMEECNRNPRAKSTKLRYAIKA